MFASLNDPSPEEVHVNETAFDCIAPKMVKVSVSQIVASAPAFTSASREMVSTIASETAAQGEAALTDMVRVTVPFKMSDALGV